MLCGLGLKLLSRGDERHQSYVDEQRVLAAEFLAHLPDRFHERQRLDVAHCAADFHNCHVHVLRHFLHRSLDFIRHVRDHLHGFAQIIAAALFGDDLLVEAAGGPVVVARKFGVGKAFVVAEVEIGFGAVVGHKNFAVLKRRHRPRIDVEIRVELHQVDFQSAALQQATDGSRGQSLA